MSYERMSTSKDALNQRKKLLEHLHDDVGTRRRNVLGILAIQQSDFALAIKFGRGVARVDKTGADVASEDADDKEDSSTPLVAKGLTLNPALRNPVMGSVPGNKRLGLLVIPCGVCLIVGPGGVGKSPLAQALAGAGVESFGMVRVGEPLSGYSSTEKETAQYIAKSMLLDTDVVIDSVKDLLSSGGGAMKSGITRDSLITLSEWSSLACDLGVTLYIPVNPSSADSAVLELLAEAARSNATSTIIYDKGDKWSYVGRTGEGLERVSTNITFTKDSLTIGSASVGKVSEARAAEMIIGSMDNYKGALRRSIIADKE